MDSRADTTCLGSTFVPIYYTGEECKVAPYLSEYERMKGIKIATALCAYDYEDTGETTTGKTITLVWKQRQFKRTCNISKSNNVASITSAPGYKNFHTYCQEAKYDSDGIIICDKTVWEPDIVHSTIKENVPTWPNKTTLTAFDGHKQLEETVTTQENDKGTIEMLHIHENKKHIPFARIQEWAKQGVIPKKSPNVESHRAPHASITGQ